MTRAPDLPWAYDPSRACYLAAGLRGWYEVRVLDTDRGPLWKVTLEGRRLGVAEGVDAAKRLANEFDYPS